MKLQILDRIKNLPRAIKISADQQSFQGPYPFYENPANYANTIAQNNSVSKLKADLPVKMVRLADCDPRKIVILTKNRIVKEQEIKIPKFEKSKSHKAEPVKEVDSNTFEQNQALFNYNKIIEQKKARKKKFLEEIESKINMIELQADNMQVDFKNQQKQILELTRINSNAKGQIQNMRVQNKISKLEKEIEKQMNRKSRVDDQIDVEMEAKEINQKLGNAYEQNQKLYQQIENKLKVRRQSKDRLEATAEIKRSNSKSKTKIGFSKTMQSTIKRRM